MKNWSIILFLLVTACLFLQPSHVLADPVLEVAIGGQTRQFGRDELLRRPDVARVDVANDISYGKAMSYRAVPLAALLAGLNPPANSVIESVALDGFVAQLPLDLVINTDPAKPIAWLAIEPADPLWPKLPRQGPERPDRFIWSGPERQWPRSAASNGPMR